LNSSNNAVTDSGWAGPSILPFAGLDLLSVSCAVTVNAELSSECWWTVSPLLGTKPADWMGTGKIAIPDIPTGTVRQIVVTMPKNSPRSTSRLLGMEERELSTVSASSIAGAAQSVLGKSAVALVIPSSDAGSSICGGVS
jgi:hypothetical protein